MGKTVHSGTFTPLHMAAKTGNADRLKHLLEADESMDVDVKDLLGYTPLHYASRYNHKDCANVLLSKGAFVNAKGNTGDTPLHRAAKWGKSEVAKLLLAKGANKYLRNNAGETPFNEAHDRWKPSENIALLGMVKAGVSVLVRHAKHRVKLASESEKKKAAIDIQRYYRGYDTRRFHWGETRAEKQARQKKELEEIKRECSPTKGTKKGRRASVSGQDKAAQKIQAMWKGHKVRSGDKHPKKKSSSRRSSVSSEPPHPDGDVAHPELSMNPDRSRNDRRRSLEPIGEDTSLNNDLPKRPGTAKGQLDSPKTKRAESASKNDSVPSRPQSAQQGNTGTKLPKRPSTAPTKHKRPTKIAPRYTTPVVPKKREPAAGFSKLSEADAATKIQASFRGHKTRKAMGGRKISARTLQFMEQADDVGAVYSEEMDELAKSQELAAKKIQKSWKKKKGGKKKRVIVSRKRPITAAEQARAHALKTVQEMQDSIDQELHKRPYVVTDDDLKSLVKDLKFKRGQMKRLLELYKSHLVEKQLGKLGKESFFSLIKDLFPSDAPPERHLVDKLFAAFDSNGDQRVDFHELVIGLNPLIYGTVQEKVAALWRLFDTNGDGHVEVPELIFLLENSYTSNICLMDFITKTVRKIDEDHNEKISIHEFEEAVLKDESLLEAFGRIIPPTKHLLNEQTEGVVQNLVNLCDFDWNFIREQWRVYAAANPDYTRSVDHDHFQLLMRACFKVHDTQAVTKCFEQFDVDKNGSVDFREFIQGLAPLRGSTHEKVRFFFELWGGQENIAITKQDLYSVLGIQMKGDVQDITRKAKQVLAECGSDSSRITLDEYKRAAERHPSLLSIFSDAFVGQGYSSLPVVSDSPLDEVTEQEVTEEASDHEDTAQ